LILGERHAAKQREHAEGQQAWHALHLISLTSRRIT
jgi:hypothetical protein